MAKLILSMDGLVLKEYTLTKERTTIGRKPHNDVQIDNLAVSGEHAVIVTILNDSFLEDLGSTNGTLVNGQPIKKHFLQNNDVVELGKYRLKYLNDTATAAAKPQDFERTMVLRPKAKGAAPAQPAVVPPAPMQPAPMAPAVGAGAGLAASQPLSLDGGLGASQPIRNPFSPAVPASLTSPAVAEKLAPLRAGAAAMEISAPMAVAPQPVAPALAKQSVAAIQVLTGSNAGRELELTKPLTTLGKPGVQVAVITKRPQGFFITHVEGAVFPVVNGQTLDAQAHALNDHDIIELAGVKMEFYLK
jgi:predicted component of type VI protein secretion system